MNRLAPRAPVKPKVQTTVVKGEFLVVAQILNFISTLASRGAVGLILIPVMQRVSKRRMLEGNFRKEKYPYNEIGNFLIV